MECDLTPKITVITVCYNSEKTIENAINSVITQGYDNLEYIIVDGGSTDRTLNIIEQYRDYFDLVISEKDNGIYDAMNKGLYKASGDLVAFLNSDDWYNEGALQKIGEEYKKNHADVLYGNIINVIGNDYKQYSYKDFDIEEIVMHMIIAHPATFVSTTLMKKIGFDDKFQIAADYKAFLKMYYLGVRFKYVNYNIVFFRHGGASTRNDLLTMEEVKYIAEEVAKEEKRYNIELQRKIDNRYYYSLACYSLNKKKYLDEAFLVIKNQLGDYEKLYIFGAGIRGEYALVMLKSMQIEVELILDNGKKRGFEVDGINVLKPEDVNFGNNIKVILTPKRKLDEIKDQLIHLGLPESNIIFFYDMFVKVGISIAYKCHQ